MTSETFLYQYKDHQYDDYFHTQGGGDKTVGRPQTVSTAHITELETSELICRPGSWAPPILPTRYKPRAAPGRCVG